MTLDWDDASIVATDLETSGHITHNDIDTGKPASAYALQPWRLKTGQGWITSASMIRHAGPEGLVAHVSQLMPTKAVIVRMLEDAIANDWTILGWNIAFDVAWLMALGDDVTTLCFKLRWLDGMLMWRHLEVEPEYEFQSQRHKKRRWRLKPEAVQQWIPTFAGLDEDVDFHATDPVSMAKLQRYNDRDNVRAWTISKMIWEKLTLPQRRAVLIEAECIPMVAEANLKGLPIDRLTVRHLSEKLDQDAAAKLAELAPDGMREDIVRSPIKLANLMFDEWKLPVLKTNKSKVEGKEDSRSTDKEVLHELAFIDGRVKKVKEYREALNAKGKFCTSVLEALDYNGDGCVHPTAGIFRTYTGRMTVDSKQGRGKSAAQIGYALHQMKRGKEYREINVAEEGYDIVEFDAAGQEFRWMAVASGDPTMLRMCLPGEDAHSFMGAQIVGVDYHQLIADVHAESKSAVQNRYLGKFANLSCIAEGQPVLTDRGYVAIEDVAVSDLVWDGLEWVSHDGVVFQGIKDVVSYGGVVGTEDHRVLVSEREGLGGDCWVELQEAARHGWTIQPALGEGRTCRRRAAFRIVGGFVRRFYREGRAALCSGTVQLRSGARGRAAVPGDRTVDPLQGLRDTRQTHRRGENRPLHAQRVSGAEASQRDAQSLHQPQEQILAQLRRAWDRVSVCVHQGGRRVYSLGAACRRLFWTGHRSEGQQRPLRARQFTPDYAQCEPEKQATYDLLNAGPRHRFVVGSCVVSNCQYRTSAKKLRVKARIDYDIPMEMPEAYRIHKTYQQTYPGVPSYWDRQIAIVRQLGYVETFGGNRVKIEGDWSGSYGWSMGSTAINYKIQGTGADQKYLAMMVIRDYLRAIGGRFLFDLHDGLYLLIPTQHSYRACVDIKRMLDNLPYQQAWGFTPPIPMPWDCKRGKAWGRLKEVKFD